MILMPRLAQGETSRFQLSNPAGNARILRASRRHFHRCSRFVTYFDLRKWDQDEIVAWSNWRMERNRTAKECHKARRREELRRRSRKRT